MSEKPQQQEPCEHDFEIDFSCAISDVAPDGIKAGVCSKCGARGSLGPFDEEGWRIVRLIRNAVCGPTRS